MATNQQDKWALEGSHRATAGTRGRGKVRVRVRVRADSTIPTSRTTTATARTTAVTSRSRRGVVVSNAACSAICA